MTVSGINFSFTLPNSFVDEYRDKKPPFGYVDAAGTSMGEVVFARTYSRKKEDGAKEQWYEVCERVINGMFSIQKDHCLSSRLPWNGPKALATAKDAYDRLFNLKWSPPGRGLWMMGSKLVNEQHNAAALQNCAFVSTKDMTKFDPAKVFAFLMEGSMLGIGMGFDTKGSQLGLVVQKPKDDAEIFTIPDTREGWVEATKQIINAYLVEGKSKPKFDYTAIRPSGAPIKTFGGTASGPAPLITLHENLVKMFEANIGEPVGAKIIADIGNMIGVCVVSGNVRRSAELLMGSIEDDEFLNLKNLDKNPDRSDWYWMSNNSVEAKVGDDLSAIAEGVKRNGEPGVIWMDVTRKYGRLKDAPNNKDWRAAGYNPCAEQSLESFECCTLSESYLMNTDSLEDYLKTLKVAYLYAKTVTLLPTHWPETNAIMQRNRRIGMSMSGIADFVDSHGLPSLREYMDKGYDEVQRLDEVYSEWLCVRPSIKTTTVKPSGTVSLLAGTSPGVHWTVGGSYFIRRVIFDKNDPVVEQFRNSGYPVIDSVYTPETSVVVEFPIKSKAKRSEADVSIFEKAFLASEAQRYWSDNSVSVTVSFDPETEGDHIEKILHMYEGSLKTVSFLPMGGAYQQMPYESITEDEWEERRVQILPVDLSPIYGLEAEDAAGEKYCSTDACEIKEFTSTVEDYKSGLDINYEQIVELETKTAKLND